MGPLHAPVGTSITPEALVASLLTPTVL